MTVLKIIFYIILVGGLIYGGYTAYTKWWGGEEFVKKAKEITENFSGQAQNYTKESVEKVKDSAQKKVKETIEDYSKKAAVSAVSFVKDKIDSLAQSIIGTSTLFLSPVAETPKNYLNISDVSKSGADTFIQSTSSVFFVPPPPTAIVTKINAPLVFSVNKAVIYAIDWGDGLTGGGENLVNKTKLIEHSWIKEGDYNVQIVMKEEGKTNIYTFPVRVYE